MVLGNYVIYLRGTIGLCPGLVLALTSLGKVALLEYKGISLVQECRCLSPLKFSDAPKIAS